jgi:hypothetical protein
MTADGRIWFVFDAESIGLYGETFAVAWVVVGPTGDRLEECVAWCSPDEATGRAADREWIGAHVAPHLAATGDPTHASTRDVRDAFWAAWRRWAERGATAAADVCCPVEAGLVRACVSDDASRTWDGPYPLVDIASVVLATGGDPLSIQPRRADEEPAHHPLCDARQSARLLLERLP